MSGVFFETPEGAEAAKTGRPLAKRPHSVWVHNVPSVETAAPDGKPRTLRRYSTEVCTSTGRGSTSCHGCTTQDPFWDKLKDKDKFNKKGQRVDFPKRKIHLLPMLDVTEGRVTVLRGGNQAYDEMDKWYDTQPVALQDLSRCEWKFWKTGSKFLTKYTTMRMDATPFTITPELDAEAKAAMQRAFDELKPLKREAFIAMINAADPADSFAEPNSGTYSAPAPQQTQQFVTGLQQTVAPSATSAELPPWVETTPPPPVAKPVVAVQQPLPPQNGAEEFTKWVSSQPEFQGMGMILNLAPVLDKTIKTVNYHNCTPEQLVQLRAAAEAKLQSLRKKA